MDSWKLKEEGIDRAVWKIRLRRGYGPVVRETTKWMNEKAGALRNIVLRQCRLPAHSLQLSHNPAT